MIVVEKINDHIRSLNASIHRSQELYVHAARVEPLIKTLSRFRDARVIVITEKILVCVKVKKLAEIDTVLEYLQDELSIEFDRSHDYAEQSWRTFESKDAKWIRVDAELAADGPECRRVIVGYETVPKYELKCGEDAAQPDAPMPEMPKPQEPF